MTFLNVGKVKKNNQKLQLDKYVTLFGIAWLDLSFYFLFVIYHFCMKDEKFLLKWINVKLSANDAAGFKKKLPSLEKKRTSNKQNMCSAIIAIIYNVCMHAKCHNEYNLLFFLRLYWFPFLFTLWIFFLPRRLDYLFYSRT